MNSIYAGPWCGAVHEDQVTLKASIVKSASQVRLIFSKEKALTNKTEVQPQSLSEVQDYQFKIANFHLQALEANTRYQYSLEVNGTKKQGTFKTFPQKGNQANFRFAFSSCSNKYPEDKSLPIVYEKIIENEFENANDDENIFFFCHVGDLHYGDLKKDPVHERLKMLDRTVRRTGFGELFQKLPVVYIWDDHDFLGNNSGGGNKSKRKYANYALESYDLYVPHYDFGGKGIYQEFTIGKVHFIITDLRYNQKTKKPYEFWKQRKLLGKEQTKWLMSKLIEGKSQDLMVWVNTIPWIGGNIIEKLGGNTWGAFSDERKNLARFIKKENISNLCMVSGDAHMVAIDDGSHSGYAEKSKGGFPVFHAASLDSSISTKGGPYSIGKANGTRGGGIGGRGQYGIIEITYKNGKLHVHWEGKRVKANGDVETLIAHDFESPNTYKDF